MESLQATKEKLGLNSRRFTTCFVVFAIAFPVVLIVTSMYQNSIFSLFEGFSKDKLLVGTAQNVNTETHEYSKVKPNATTNNSREFGGRVQIITDEHLGNIDNNITASEVLQTETKNVTRIKGRDENVKEEDLERRDKNVTASEVLQGETQNVTTIKGRVQNITVSDTDFKFIGSKNASLPKMTNDTTITSLPNNSSHPNKTPIEKLLDGLLASGFDESSCISRYQSYLYRKSSHHKPSPYLISKLRSYEESHRKCGPHTRAYNRTMIKLVRSENNKANTMCKYIVWTPVNGLGNRMISLGAAFLYAVMTDRVLLVKFETDMMGLFCEPFLDSTWILPKNFPFKNPHRPIETYQSWLKRYKGDNPPSVLHLRLQHSKDDPEKLFHCERSQNLLMNVPLLILQTDQYFVPSLFMIPTFNQELIKMFPEKDRVFHHLGRYLFHPSNEAWGLITRFYKTYMEKADERIGLQIRVFNAQKTPHEEVMDLLLSCTLKNKLLPELDTRENSLTTSTLKNQSSKAVLVASLHPEYSEELRTMYLTNPTVNGEIVGVYQPSHEEHQKFYDNEHNMKAWTDIYLLSLSDVLVTTSLSTFGYVAQGLGGLKPWLLYRLVGKEDKVHEPACVRDFSMEPCYHIPPKHNCQGKLIEDFGSLFPYMRKCEDYYFGVKL